MFRVVLSIAIIFGNVIYKRMKNGKHKTPDHINKKHL